MELTAEARHICDCHINQAVDTLTIGRECAWFSNRSLLPSYTADSDHQMQTPPLFVRADRLGRLALSAATEIDKIQRGRSSNFAPIHDFIDEIVPATIEASSGADLRAYLDPAGAQMFSAALSSVSHKRPTDTDALYKEIRSFFSSVRNVGPNSNEKPLALLKSFCIVVYDCLIQHRSSSGLQEQGVFDYDDHLRKQAVR